MPGCGDRCSSLHPFKRSVEFEKRTHILGTWQEGDRAAAAVAALVVVLALRLEQHERVMIGVVQVRVRVVIVVLAAAVVVVVRLVVVVFAEEVAVVAQRELVARHELALAQSASEALDVVDLALGSHHEVRPAEAQAALVALGPEYSAIIPNTYHFSLSLFIPLSILGLSCSRYQSLISLIKHVGCSDLLTNDEIKVRM